MESSGIGQAEPGLRLVQETTLRTADWKAISGHECHAPGKLGASRIHGTLNHLDSKVRITTANQ
jgi:hypothetical protein